MGALRKDLAFAVRMLRKQPLFALTAAVTLALGIGATTAIFSVVHAVLLRPLPYKDEGRLVLVWMDLRARNQVDFPIAPGDFADLRQHVTQFEGLAVVLTFRQAAAGDSSHPPEQIHAGIATPNLFSLLGSRVIFGRDFTDADGTPPPPPTLPAAPAAAQPAAGQAQAAPAPPPQPPPLAILSYEFWQRRFGGDPSVVGRVVDLGGPRFDVIGILQPGFELLFPPRANVERTPDIWTPIRINFANDLLRTNLLGNVIGRLKPGVRLAEAQAQVDALNVDLRKRFSIKETSGQYLRLEPMRTNLVAEVRPSLVALMGAVVFVLLIACANVANLLLVRASARERELAVRAALGGSRWQLVRQMLSESLVLAGAGAGLGLGLAWLGIRLLLAIGPANLPRIGHVEIDLTVLGVTALATIASAVLFGLLPAIHASRPDVMEVLRKTGRASSLGSGRWVRSGVVMAEVALAFVLLVGSGLMLRSFVALQHADPGYEPSGLLTFLVPNLQARAPGAATATMRALRDHLGAIPGVTGVTAASPFPLDGRDGNAFARYGRESALADPSRFQQATVFTVLPGYFELMRTRLVEGRTFTEVDNNADAKLVVVDTRLVAKMFPNESPIGKQLLVRIRTNDPETFQIIGVVAHERTPSLASDGREEIFCTDGLLGPGRATRWAIRTTGDPTALVAAVRAEIAKVNPKIGIFEVQPLMTLVDKARASTQFALILIGIFGGMAAVLTAVGLYGVISTVVRQRTAEIGVRMAFGAASGEIFGLIVGYGLRLSAAGIVIGFVSAFFLTQVMASLLIGVKPTDPPTFGAIAVGFFVVASLACSLPALRAARLDPNVALRDE
jgi:putative ABC transport system permease protein